MEMLDSSKFKYAAFISYRHTPLDKKWAKWLISALEKFRIPRALIKAGYPGRLGKVYRDEDEFTAAPDLHLHIKKALDQSKFLIVICSPNTPASKWVDQEIEYFREIGRGDNILALLVDGEPDDSFPEALWLKSDTGEKLEPAAADVRLRSDLPHREVKDVALMRIIAGVIGCGYDELRNRERRRKTRTKVMMGLILRSLILFFLGYYGYNKTQLAQQSLKAQVRTLDTQGRLLLGIADEAASKGKSVDALALALELALAFALALALASSLALALALTSIEEPDNNVGAPISRYSASWAQTIILPEEI